MSHFGCKDLIVCDLIEFGFPIGFVGNEDDFIVTKEIWKYKNYKGAEEYPIQLDDYLLKEMKHGAILCPFKSNPFSHNLWISPLNTYPTKQIPDMRVILDLSNYTQYAVNS